jgi:ketosteroid isomerase-like protein
MNMAERPRPEHASTIMTAVSIEDRFAISDLFIRYTCALDAGEVDTLVDCFAEDGALVSPAVGSHAGHAAIRAFAERFAMFRRNGSQLRHVISNLIMRVDGDHGHATCYLTVFLTRDGTSRLLAPGQYDCELRKVDGNWRFQNRIVRHDHDYTLEGL